MKRIHLKKTHKQTDKHLQTRSFNLIRFHVIRFVGFDKKTNFLWNNILNISYFVKLVQLISTWYTGSHNLSCLWFDYFEKPVNQQTAICNFFSIFNWNCWIRLLCSFRFEYLFVLVCFGWIKIYRNDFKYNWINLSSNIWAIDNFWNYLQFKPEYSKRHMLSIQNSKKNMMSNKRKDAISHDWICHAISHVLTINNC